MPLLNDLRFAARLLARERGFAITASLALAFGIAANTTVFTLVNGALIRDLPFANPDRIVGISTQNPGDARRPFDNLSYPELRDLQASARTFDGIAAVDQVPMNVADPDRPVERFIGAYITANTFSLIGHRPTIGRDFTASDDRPGAEAVVILAHRLWQSRYGARADIVGRTMRVNGVASTIVGVMPPGFEFPERSSLWQPLAIRPWSGLTDRGVRNIDGIGRMKPDVTIDAAAADLDRVMDRLAQAFPATNEGIQARVRPYRDLNTGGPLRLVLAALMGAVGVLLLVACANVANLLLARGAVRAREISIRLSLGAARLQIVRQLLVESLLLAALGGTAGIMLAMGGVRLVDRFTSGTGEPYWLDFPLDGTVLAFFLAVSAAAAVISGIVPALQTSGTSVAGVMNEAGRSMTGSRRHRRWTDALVVTQLALTLVLLTAAGLMIRNAVALSRVDAGIDVSNLLTAQVELTSARYASPDSRRAFYERLEERLAATPGLRAGVGSWAPLGGAYSRGVLVDGAQEPSPDERPRASHVIVSPGYFRAIGIAPVRGRTLSTADSTPASPVAVVNARFAALHFPDRDPIGQRIALDAAGTDLARTGWLSIVGIVSDVRHEEADPSEIEPVVYTPLASQPLVYATIVAGLEPGIATVTSALRGIVAGLDPDLPVFDVKRLESSMADEQVLRLAFGSLFGTFAGMALLLAAVGVYGVMAFAAAQRRREIGVRIALGARPRDVWWVVARRALQQLAVGLALGTAGALAAGQVLQGLLFGLSSRDPLTFLLVAAVLVLATVAACIGPTRRATRVDPVAALRAE